MSREFLIRRAVEIDHSHRMARRRAALVRQVVLVGMSIVGAAVIAAVTATVWVLQ